jgi:2-methylcitrate dehydratase PrpD
MSNMSASSFAPAQPSDGCHVARLVAAYVVSARSQAVSPEARAMAVKCIFDAVITTATAIDTNGPVAPRKTALQLAPQGRATIWFTGKTSSSLCAAWANATVAASADLDDTSYSAVGHPGAAIIPTALAIGQETGATLDQIIAAIVIGYEVGVTIGAARKRDEFGVTITWAAFAVVATAAALLGLDAAEIEQALGIAGGHLPTHTPLGPPRLEGSDVKEGIAWAVHTGIMSVLMAQNGHTGPRNVLNIKELYDYPEDLKLGSSQRILDTYFKLSATCRYTHAPADAAWALVKQHGISVEEIVSIEIHTFRNAVRLKNVAKPGNLVDVIYSIPYCVALVLKKGPEIVLPLTEDVLGLPDVEMLAGKVKMVFDQEIDGCFPARGLSRVVIKTTSGQTFTSETIEPKGVATAPLTWEELKEKCRQATRFVAGKDQQETLISAVEDIRDKSDIGPLLMRLGGLTLSKKG